MKQHMTTMKVSQGTKAKLDKLRIVPSESYDDLLSRLSDSQPRNTKIDGVLDVLIQNPTFKKAMLEAISEEGIKNAILEL